MLKLKNMNEKRFVDHDTSVEDYVESLENRNTKEKTKRDVKLLETFLRNEKNDEREVQDIEPAELNKHLAEFIRSVRRKDGEDYEPSSLRCLVSSIERHLKKNNYTKSIINEGCPIHPHRNVLYKPCVDPYGSNGSTTGVYVL